MLPLWVPVLVAATMAAAASGYVTAERLEAALWYASAAAGFAVFVARMVWGVVVEYAMRMRARVLWVWHMKIRAPLECAETGKARPVMRLPRTPGHDSDAVNLHPAFGGEAGEVDKKPGSEGGVVVDKKPGSEGGVVVDKDGAKEAQENVLSACDGKSEGTSRGDDDPLGAHDGFVIANILKPKMI